MLSHPDFDPVAFSLFGLSVHWYGLMYVLGFVCVLLLGRRHLRRGGAGGVTALMFDEMVFFGILGVILGGRLGYVIFYQFDDYIGRPVAAAIDAAFSDGGGVWAALADSLAVVKMWEGGMSFHGGLVGVIVGLWWVARRNKIGFWRAADFIAPLAAPGLGFGRIGNFINGELWGRPTDLPWGMVFAPPAGDAPRHPSQLYEFALEGVVLFALLWAASAKPRPAGWISGVFLLGYAAMRFIVEFAREPDAHLGFILWGLSMGQLLCLPMAAAGLFMLFRQKLSEAGDADAKKTSRRPPPTATTKAAFAYSAAASSSSSSQKQTFSASAAAASAAKSQTAPPRQQPEKNPPSAARPAAAVAATATTKRRRRRRKPY